MVRFDTYNASAHLVRQLENSGVATVTHDGGDNVLVELKTGHEISIHLIETRLPLYEIRLNLTESGEADIHSLFIVWSAMFLPDDNELFVPEAWMMALVKLYGGKLYAFDVYGKDIRIFATYFEKVDATHYRVRFGDDVDVTRLGVEQVSLSIPELAGTWLIADFAGVVPPRKRPQTDHKTHFHQQNAHHHARRAPTRPPETPWEILGVAKSARRDEVKRAFRKLARRLHPDLNTAPDATHQMQRLNVAYQAVLRELGEDL
ncbi:MAG: J domain-containing protein [Chloroflexi bacterium]|nr:J domain-containing protein [Chloroflexota bacterium]